MNELWLSDGPVRLFAVEEGAGPTLLFLHGGLANYLAVRPYVWPLVDRYRVVTPDVRGGGRSWSAEELAFDRLADDLALILDHLGVERALVGGVSSGTGPAVRFALRHPGRLRALLVVKPIYGGEAMGYTDGQIAAFAGMDAVASRAADEGIEVLLPLYARLPEGMRERAWKVASEFDPASVVATSRFIASGAQPFGTARDLAAIQVPTLLVRGDDPQHPAEVSDLYAASIPDCTVREATVDVTEAIREFCDGVTAG